MNHYRFYIDTFYFHVIEFPVLEFYSSHLHLQLSGKEEPDIHCRDSVGNTPLHCAAYRGQKQCIIKLLKSGADPSIRNKNGISQLSAQYTTAVMLTVKVQQGLFIRIHITFLKVMLMSDSCMIDCIADQTALDLACSDELRLILAAYQDKVGAEK